MTLFKDWLIRSKNWQLRLTVVLFFLPLLALSYFVHAGTGFAAMGIALATIVLLVPKIRSQIMVASRAQLLVSAGFFLVSLGMIMFSPPYLIWGYTLNQGLYFMAITLLSLSNAAKAAKVSLDKAAERLRQKAGMPAPKKKDSKKVKAGKKKAKRQNRK